jgi:hypothetical protein
MEIVIGADHGRGTLKAGAVRWIICSAFVASENVTPTAIAEARQFIKNANILVHQLQMSVTPKGHMALVHACEKMETMSHGREDRIEVWHQFGKAADIRTSNARKSAQRFLQISRCEQINRNPLIALHKETIQGEFALSESTLLKRKANWDNNSRSKKRQTTTREKLYEQSPCWNANLLL